jgi:hypothetical protein
MVLAKSSPNQFIWSLSRDGCAVMRAREDRRISIGA